MQKTERKASKVTQEAVTSQQEKKSVIKKLWKSSFPLYFVFFSDQINRNSQFIFSSFLLSAAPRIWSAFLYHSRFVVTFRQCQIKFAVKLQLTNERVESQNNVWYRRDVMNFFLCRSARAAADDDDLASVKTQHHFYFFETKACLSVLKNVLIPSKMTHKAALLLLCSRI